MATPTRKTNLSPKSKAGSQGYDVVIGARKKHFDSHRDAHAHGTGQQNKGVHAVFVIVDNATGEKETFTRAGKKSNPSSTFYHDGFRDGKAGQKSSPPDKSVYAAEYRKGYEDGKREAREQHSGKKSNPTIYQALQAKLGRVPTNAELKAEVSRIKREGYELAARKGKLFHQRKRNPESGAIAMRESFTGMPSKKTIVVGEDLHYHGNVAALGELVSLRVKPLDGEYKGKAFEVGFSKQENPKAVAKKVKGWIDRRATAVTGMVKGFNQTWLNPKKANPKGPVILACSEDGKNLLCFGGDQSIDLDSLGLGAVANKESVVIGPITTVEYFTTKQWPDKKKPETAIYVHSFSEDTGGPLPVLRYSTVDKKCFIDGGTFHIPKPLIGTSSGIND